MKKCQIEIKGMHCRSCEILITDALQKIPNVKKAKVNHSTGIAEITYQGKLDQSAVQKAVEAAGYSLGKEDYSVFSKNIKDYQDLGAAFFIVTIFYFIAKNLGILDLSKSLPNNYSNLLIVLLVGLTAGISTCMAMVGGLILGIAAQFSKSGPQKTGWQKFIPHLYFNLGRILSYFVLGGLIGFVGSFFQLSTSILGLLIIGVGVLMLLLGGQLIEIFPILKKFSFTLPASLTKLFGIKERVELEYSNKNAAIMGALTFFLPCGFTQAMQLYAMSSGSALKGALVMGVFALGTAPGLIGIGGLTSVVKGEAAKYFFKVVGVVVMILALFNISNGLNLLGVGSITQVLGAISKSKNTPSFDPNVALVGGVQEVRMTQTANGYSPNSFTIKKGIAVKWIILSENSNSCAASIVSPSLNIRKILQQGENVLEFTPQNTGQIRFSCMMGMYTGEFNVVDDAGASVASPSNNLANNVTPTNAPAGSYGGCGGGSGGCGCGGGAKQ